MSQYIISDEAIQDLDRISHPVELFVYELPTGSVFLTEIIVTICVNLTL
jgi:hypothetical protein